ncbi:MAG TPA: hypothetical protein VLC50_07095 [Actinomycetes bacterium]|nr:hypothetical protein [Actinomycetes bacterium]
MSILREVDLTAWLTASYAVFLVVVAHGFDRLARVVARSSERWRSGGFVYHEDHDAWLCPQDQMLWPVSFDAKNRVVRYRAKPSICNSCPVKDTCTTSDSGREITRDFDPWPHSEAGRFHRGIACTVAALGAALPVATLFVERNPVDVLVLVVTVLLVGVASLPLVSHFRHSPAGFPDLPIEGESGGPDAVARPTTDRYTTIWGMAPTKETR